MSLFIPSRLNFRRGEWPVRGLIQGAASTGHPKSLLCILVLLLSAVPAQAGYLEDLNTSAQFAPGFPTFGSPQGYYPAVSSGGIGVVRLRVPWKDLEPAPGQYEWAALDARIADLQEVGIEPFLTFEADPESAAPFPAPGFLTFMMPNSMPDWSTFVSLTVDRYNGDGWNDAPGIIRPIRYYEVMNVWADLGDLSSHRGRTDAGIVAYVNNTYDAIKSVDASAVFVLGGIENVARDALPIVHPGTRHDMWDNIWPDVQLGVWPAITAPQPKSSPSVWRIKSLIAGMKFDAVDLRQFGTPGDSLRIEATRDVIGNVPLLSTECDSPAIRYREFLPEDHFMAVVEHNLTDLSESLEHCLWLRINPESDANGGDSQVAPLDEDIVDKPGHAAYSMLAFILQDMTAVERGAGNSFTIYRADNPPLVVAWLEDDQLSGTLTLPDNVAGSVMRVTDPVLGTYEIEPPVDGGWVVLSQWPLVAGELPWAELAGTPN